MPVTNWTAFFSEEHDVFVQNIANAQVSLEFELQPGRSEGFLFKQSRDPVNLTQHIPFNAIKNSVQFRKMINRNPPVLLVITEEEFHAYYARKAAIRGTTVEAAINQAESDRMQLAQKVKAPTTSLPQEEVTSLTENEPVSENETINPRILHLMTQVSVEIPPAERMPAKELVMALQEMEDVLTPDDLEYVRSRGLYQSVKKWASSVIARKIETAQGEGLPDGDEVTA